MNSTNIPHKSNFKKFYGFDSLMGDSNFDISEDIILKMINEFKDSKSALAFLCKITVARNIFKELFRNKIEYSYIKILNFNGQEVFKVNVNCCLFVLHFGDSQKVNNIL